MRCEWKEVELSEVADLTVGFVGTMASHYTENGILFLRSTNIEPFNIKMDDVRYISPEFNETIKKSQLNPDDVVIVRTGKPGACTVIPQKTEPWNCSDLVIIHPNKEKINPHFLASYINLASGVINAHLVGAVQQHFNVGAAKKMKIPLPPIHIQNRIASIIQGLNDKIELNNKINENLERQAQILFKEWFIDSPDVPLWQEGTFSDLIEKTISGDWGKDSPSGNNTEMVYCIRGTDIPEIRAGNKGKMPTRYILPKNYAAKQLVDGDIIVEISGGSPTQSTGRAAIISTALLNRFGKGMVCTNFCKALKPKAGYSMYLYHYWQHLYDMSVFFSYENGTTGIKNLDLNGFIETEPIHIAPAELVDKFDIFCQTVFSKVYSNGLENEHLAELRDVLLPKLMSGEIQIL